MTSSIPESELDCIRNGMIVDGYGHRAVAFTVDSRSAEIRIRNMISQKTSEKIYGWNSGVQSVRKDDYVVISSWTPEMRKTQVYRKSAKGLVPSRTHGGSFNSRLIDKLPESIIDFLNYREGGPSYLPSGPWRTRYDMITTMSKKRIESFLKPYISGDWLAYITEEAQKVPEQHLIIDWGSYKVQSLPTTMQSHEEYWTATTEDDSEVYVYNSMVWVLIHEDGTVTIHEHEPTSGSRYVGPSRRIIETFRAEKVMMPKTVVKAIQFNLGAYEKDERSYGARWYLYKRGL